MIGSRKDLLEFSKIEDRDRFNVVSEDQAAQIFNIMGPGAKVGRDEIVVSLAIGITSYLQYPA